MALPCFACRQWLQLGVAAVASEPKLHWALFLAGALCGLLVDQSLRAFQERSPHSACIRQRLTDIIGFNGKMNLLALLLWFVIEILGPPGYHMGMWNISQFQSLSLRPGLSLLASDEVRNCALDAVWFCGTAQLLLKKKRQEELAELCNQLSK